MSVQQELDKRELVLQWNATQSAMAFRTITIGDLQLAADAYAAKLAIAIKASEAVWASLPELPAHRPATYGRDLYTRAALYLYGVTEGRSGGSAASTTSAHVARQRPDLLALDAGSRDVLLLPFTKLKEAQ